MRKKIFVFSAVILIIIAIFGLGKQISKALQATKRLDIATDRLSKLQAEQRKLQNQLTEVKSIAFIEQQIRNKLGMVRSNETIMIIPQDQIDKVLGLNKKAPEIQIPNYQGWLKLIFH